MEKTDFTALGGSFTIREGVVDNQDLSMMSPLLRIRGAGRANLRSETVDYGLKVSVVGSLEGQGGDAASDLRGLTIPLRVKGSLLDPKFSLDFESAALSFQGQSGGQGKAGGDQKGAAAPRRRGAG